jgi:SAM-dependent methyltransferase
MSVDEGPGASDSPTPVTYALGRDAAEAERLRRQTIELEPLAAELLDSVGAAEGQSAIDVGCGPRGILELLAERVGPRGRVVGLEVDPVHVAMARQLVAEQGLTNVEVIQADARNTGLPPASFDVAHARTVLVNVPDPEAVLAEMTRLVRAGGWVASLEPDVAVDLCHRVNPAWDRLHQIFITAVQAVGADPFIGRRLPELFREAGLSDIGVRAHAELYPPGHTRRTIRLDLVRSMRPKIMALGIASEQELDDLDRAAREHLDDPHTLVLPHLFFLVWGRKPTT